jgi:biopolymer transport protein ExbD
MEKKLTIEELEKQCLEAEKHFKSLHEQLNQAKKEEEDAKRAKLEAEKQTRYDEIVAVYKHFEKLRNEYVEDYGCFTFKSTNKNENSHSWFWNSIGVI